MNSFVCRGALPQLRLLYQARSAGYWNKDWKPGPYPETPEQRVAAAKKYNLLPEEYEPYPKDLGVNEPGDYPKLPDVSVENKDVYYPWDLPDERRNFGEPMNVNAIYYGEQRCDSHVHEKLRYPPLIMFLTMAGCLLFLYSLKFDPFKFFPPVAAKHIPKPGVVHYTYERVE